jgi:hypothetical protein
VEEEALQEMQLLETVKEEMAVQVAVAVLFMGLTLLKLQEVMAFLDKDKTVVREHCITQMAVAVAEKVAPITHHG